MRSIRRFLLLWSLPLVALVALAAALVGYSGSRHEAEEILDTQMTEYARLLATALPAARDARPPQRQQTAPASGRAASPGHEYEAHLTFQYWIAGRLITRSRHAPRLEGHADGPGFHTVEQGDRNWRVFTLQLDGDRRILVAEDEYVRDEVALTLAAEALLPLLISVPILGVLLSLVIDRAIRRVNAIAADVAERNPTDLSPVTTREAPKELWRLLESINGLLERLRGGIEREKQFSADAAHELRTPITGIRIHLQNAMLAAPEHEGDLRESLQRAEVGVDRMSHIVEQLLRFNRAFNQVERNGTAALDLESVLLRAIETQQPLLRERGQQLVTRIGSAHVHGNHELLAIVFGNLLANASQYTPRNGTIGVSMERDEAAVHVHVEDSGPGMPEDERRYSLLRFRRGEEGARSPEGCGLGLAIAQRICERHDATITLATSDTLGGLRATVTFALVAA